MYMLLRSLWVLTYNQTVKAIAEAEAYPGPSLIIAYAPCINHGIKKGMSKAQTEEELAVKAGYWHLFRFNPAAENKFTLDSKAPTRRILMEFLNGEVRYNSLKTMQIRKELRNCSLRTHEVQRGEIRVPEQAELHLYGTEK